MQAALQALDEVYVTVAEKRLPEKPKPDVADLELLEKALAFYQRFAEQNKSDTMVWPELMRAYHRVGQIRELLGDSREAERAYRQAVAIPEQVTPRKFAAILQFNRSVVYESLAGLLRESGRLPEAETAARGPPGVGAVRRARQHDTGLPGRDGV